MATYSQQVDYSQWQRRKKETQQSGQHSTAQLADLSYTGFGTFSIGSELLSRVGSACSLSKCNHPWNNFRAMEAARNAREKKRARMKEINVKIRMQEKTLMELKARQAEIIRSNMELFHSIEAAEREAISQADDKLRLYQKSRDGISVMRLRFERQRRELEMEVKSMKRQLDASIAKLQAEVDIVVQQVKDVYAELSLLNNYKDKIYPERLVVIHQLKQKLASDQLSNEMLQQLLCTGVLQNNKIQQLGGFGEEESELLQIIQAEHKKLVESDANDVTRMRKQVAESAMSELHPTIVDMSKENQQLQFDIKFHADTNRTLSEEINRLQIELDRLRSQSGKTTTEILFPSLFKHEEKCTPDTELVFDIPTRKLPVI